MNFIQLLCCTLLEFLIFIKRADGIHCFECTSYNHDNPDCEDPFNRPRNVRLHTDCMAGLPGRYGLFRATHCLKLVAKGYGYSYVVRTCALDSGSGRMDKEIVSLSHCGFLSLDNFYGFNVQRHPNKTQNSTTSSNNNIHSLLRDNIFKGCLSVCQHDECNSAHNKHRQCIDRLLLLLFILTFSSLFV